MENIIEKINKIHQLYTDDIVKNGDEMLSYVNGLVERSYFIKKLSERFSSDWFEFAYEKGLIAFDQIPLPVKYEEDNGNFSQGFRNWEGAFPILEAAKNIEMHPKITNSLIKIIDDYIILAHKNKSDSDRNFTVDYYICSAIMLLPLEHFNNRYLSFIIDFGLARDRSILSRELVGNFFNKALTFNHDLAFNLLELFFKPIKERRLYKVQSLIDDHALEIFSKSAPPQLFEQLGPKVVEWAVDKLESVNALEPLPFTKFDLPSLEPDSQNSSESDYNFSMVRLVIGLLSCLSIEELEGRISGFIDKEQGIMRRIGYFIIDRNYGSLNGQFWKQSNPLNDFDAKLEIYRLINRNCLQFAEDHVKILIQWINDLVVDRIEKEDEPQYKRHVAYRKLEWYVALEPIHYRFTELLIQPFNQLTETTEGRLPEHPGYDSYFSIRPGGDYSETNRILNKPVNDVLNILANPKKWHGYNVYGLQQDLQLYVVNSYSTVSENLSYFEAIPLEFIYNFMDGFRSIAEKSGTLNIIQTLTFINSFIDDRNDLWERENETHEKSTSIGMIAWVINSIIRNNEYQVTINEIKLAIDSLIKMENRYTTKFTWLNSEPVNDVINSTRGKIYDALFNCSIRETKVNGDTPFWNKEVEELFTNRLQSHTGGPEFYWSIGFNIPQISYLNLQWLLKNKSELIQYSEQGFDSPVFYGYLLFSSQLYTDLFKIFYSIYFEQVSILHDNGTITRRLVEHIWVAYAIDLDESKDLLELLIKTANQNQLGFLIDRIKIDNGINDDDKIRFVWNNILPIAENSTSKTLRKKLFELVYFAELFVNFEESDLDLFLRSIRLSRSDINSYRLLKIIEAKLSSNDIVIAGKLLKILLENISVDAFFDEEKLIELIEKLYQNNLTRLANSISIAAVERRNFRLVNIYNKYNKQDSKPDQVIIETV